jgi:hypothetical protein
MCTQLFHQETTVEAEADTKIQFISQVILKKKTYLSMYFIERKKSITLQPKYEFGRRMTQQNLKQLLPPFSLYYRR